MNADRPNKRPSHHTNDEELLSRAIPIDAVEEEDEPSEEAAASGESRQPRKAQSPNEPAPIEFDDADDGDHAGERPRIHSLSTRAAHQEKPWKRQPNANGQGATHVKTFVAKLRYEAIEHLDEQVNEWLDQHPECEVKFVTTAIGPLTGKLTEDALFVNVWV